MIEQGIDGSKSTLASAAALSIDELIGQFGLANEASGKSEKTRIWYSEILHSLLRHLKTKYPCPDLCCLNMIELREYTLYLRGKPKFKGHPHIPEQNSPISPVTVQDHIRVAKVFSSFLYEEGYTKENRLKALKLPKADQTIVEPLTYDELNKIMRSIDENSPCGPRNKTIIELMNDSGLRAQEAAQIQLAHVNLDKGYLKVMGKGRKERIVPIGRMVQRSLLRYITLSRPKPKVNACDNMFLSITGCPITANTIKLLFSRLAKESGVLRLHAHLCRHTFAINYLLNGGDVFSLQAILGHTTLEMVRHYLHFTTAQVAAQHHKYSPMDKFYGE